MKTKLTLKPGQLGTRKLVKKYGERLVCVRYRYDEKARKRYKTVEIIEEIVEWHPQDPASHDTTLVEIKLDWVESELRAKVKREGALWNPQRKVWRLSYGAVLRLGLEKRIVSPKRKSI